MSMDEFSVSNKSATSKVVVVQERGSDNDDKNMVMLHHHHQHHDDNHHRPSPSYDVVDGNGRGPTCDSKGRSSSSGIYNVIGGVAGAFDTSSSGGLRPLQPFHIGVPADTATRTTQNIIKSPGGMAASMGFPFTTAQWKELERQAMIYKYMVNSLPVPPDLLFPIIRNPSLSAAPLGSGLNLLRLSSGGDQEPGRCKRTDGKKWRCSRNVEPDQKYCERHLHRGRPRSRKPVELPPPSNKKKSRLEPHPPSLPPPVPNSIINNNTSNLFTSPSQYVGTMPQTFYSPIESLKEQRCLDWTMKGEPIQMSSSSSQEWHHLMQQTGMGLATESSFSNTCCNSSVLNLQYGEHSLNLNSYSNFSGSEEQQSTEFPFFINPDLVALEKQHQADPPRGFIDAWSNGVSDDDHNAHSKSCSVSSNGNLPLSPLSLSMGGNNRFGEEMGQVHKGLSVSESGQDNECSTKPPLSSWLNPVAWPGSTPGGPLAEVLRPSTVTSASDPPSPAAENGDPGSPPTTRLSSPSGVLQKTLASFSDSSGNSSPTLASSRANIPSEVALLWLNRDKL